MATIKVTGYIDTDNLYEHQVDLSEPTGLTVEGYSELVHGGDEASWELIDLDMLDFELVED